MKQMGTTKAIKAIVASGRSGYTGSVVHQIVQQKTMTVEEYLRFEERARERHEFVGGVAYAHAGGKARHNVIATNILGLLWNATRGGPCRTYGSDMKLRVGDAFYYPDVMVVCGEDEAGDESVYQESPSVVVEVTSPSTRLTDSREKLVAYKSLPGLVAYLIVDQDHRRVEMHHRDVEAPDRWWLEEVTDDGELVIPKHEITLSLDQIYERV